MASSDHGGAPHSAAVFRMPQTGAPASVIAFHPYNDKVVVAGHNHINMWDVGKGELLSSPEMKTSFTSGRVTKDFPPVYFLFLDCVRPPFAMTLLSDTYTLQLLLNLACYVAGFF